MNNDVRELIDQLEPLKREGLSALQAARTVQSRLARDGASGVPHETIVRNGAAMGQAVAVVFEPLTPAQLAIILHDLYPDLSAVEVGRIILAVEGFKDTPPATLLGALTGAGFDENTATDAVNILYPIAVTIHADQYWQNTGLIVTGRQLTQIAAAGSWTANPATGMVGPNGNRGLPAKSGYVMPHEPEGALVGRIGDHAPFLVGERTQVSPGQAGALQLCINDDWDGRYGAGLKDNIGTLRVEVVTLAS
ncbi:hypothetical protein [Burkholderia plantarii]|uniref:hypothetical protein n=1 Tax=Burkholderia plantarii TaxID=41899 RepID=UPI0006D89CCD|nr:hypothetical protein [Burkholderia plantarii]ALK30373.1 dehydrogenase subunit [Burkholderia plantarii]WLE59067.1 hypothetical protein GIY62_18565 [Burkholderia plantarii]GLZ18484.1 hypothetical protein Bpla01_20140 [Burkholderia plantarii]